LESRIRAGLAVAEETWEAQADSGADAPQMRLWGGGTGQPHGAHPPSPSVLLLAAADPDLSLHSGQSPWLPAI